MPASSVAGRPGDRGGERDHGSCHSGGQCECEGGWVIEVPLNGLEGHRAVGIHRAQVAE